MEEKTVYMNIALKEAKKALKIDEVPVGAVIVKDGQVISKAYNRKEKDNQVINHAEIIAIKKANKKLNNWRLEDCEIYVTLEPCMMCTSAIIQSRIKKIYIGTRDNKKETGNIDIDLFDKKFSNIIVEEGILSNKCKEILQEFFKKLRKRKQGG